LIVAAGLLGFLGSGSATVAQTPDGARSKHVVLTDLDLSTSEGQRVAYERMHQMARTLCWQVADQSDLSHQSNYVACIETAMANATAQLRAVVSRYESAKVARTQGK
jgi:UrcA family protein